MDHSLFDCLNDCQRIPALDNTGTGAGVILTPAHIAQLVAAAARRYPALGPDHCGNRIRAYLTVYVLRSPWRVLYDCQRELLMDALNGTDRSASQVIMKRTKRSAA